MTIDWAKASVQDYALILFERDLTMIDLRRYYAMRHIADSLIRDALRGRSPQWPFMPRNEVTAVQAVTMGGAAPLAAAWAHILRPLGLLVTTDAVFCHSSPQVSFKHARGAKPPVELADLLVVVDVHAVGYISRRASLIQAKVAGRRGGISLGKRKERTQFDLMSRWPVFHFTAGCYPTTRWNLHDIASPGWPRDSGRYGGIHHSFRSWRQIDVANPLSTIGFPSLGEEITNMAYGTAGRPARPAGGDPWSDLINVLLNTTYGIVYNSTPSLRRGQSSSSQFITSTIGTPSTGLALLALEPSSPVPGADFDADPPDGPVSIVYVAITGEGEEAAALWKDRAAHR